MSKLRYFLILPFLLLLACREQAAPVATSTTAPPTVAATAAPSPQLSVLADGLLNPVGITVMADGTLLIAEEGSGEKDDSAGITLIEPDGTAGRLISGLPSGRDSGDLSGVPFVAVSPDGTQLYTSHFNLGHLLTLPISSPMHVPERPFRPADLGQAMMPLNAVQILNPFDMTFAADGRPVISDASENGLAIANEDGTTRFFHRFAELPNPDTPGTTIDPVPTGITRIGAEYFVTLTGGCPYPGGSGLLVAVAENRQQRTVVAGLNMPVDVAQASDGTIWLLEFAQFDPEGSCFSGSGYLPQTGRLSKLVDGTLQPVLTGLNFPGSLGLMEDGTIYITEIFSGRLLQAQGLAAATEIVDTTQLLQKATAVIHLTPPATAAESSENVPTPTNAYFTNQANQRSLDFRHGAFQTGLSADPVAMMGAGLCWLDFDNDGWLDLYFVNSHATAESDWLLANGGLPTNALYHNQAGVFTDVSLGSGADLALRGNGCVAADFNLDGWTDIYITADGPNALLWNQGNGRFAEGAAAAGVDFPEWNTATAVTDLNSDGWPDLFVAAYIDLDKKIPNPSGAFPQDFYGLPDRLYLNNGDQTFREVTQEAGLARAERGLGATFADLDDDGDPELYIANDGHPNRLYSVQANDSPLGFAMVDLSLTAATGDSGSGMGVATADYDGNGLFDLFVTNWEAELNALYRNQGGQNEALTFRYSTYRIGLSGLGNGITGWGTTWADFDHDTDEDLLVVNGRVPITNLETDPERVRFYGNRLAEGDPQQIRDWTSAVGLNEVGPLLARGSAVADFDNDGDLDVAINCIGSQAALLVNEVRDGNWLVVASDGFYPGTIATATLADGRQLRRVWKAGSSYLASEDPRFHFGLGQETAVVRLHIRWPDGTILTLENVPANQFVTVTPPAS